MNAMLAEPDHAALQYRRGTMRAAPAMPEAAVQFRPITVSKPRELFIQGITLDGKTFRPSDWAERLAGAMSCFRPEGSAGGIAAFIGYSPYCVPTTLNGVKCVIVNEALRDIEIMAWDFVMSFARDNQLQVAEACLIPDPPQR
jgi:hypothetical protein